MSEILDEEVDYGSYGVNAFSLTDSDYAWSTYENDSHDYVTRVYRVLKSHQ